MMNEAAVLEAEYVDEERPEATGGGWRIESLADADWALRRIAELERETAEIEEIRLARVAEINARAEALTAKVERGVRFFEMHLRMYAETHRAELLKGGKAKSRQLIHGSIGWKKKGGGPKVVNEAELLTWARRQPVEAGFLRVKDEPAWDAIKKHVENSGELPPGVELTEAEDVFQVKTGGK